MKEVLLILAVLFITGCTNNNLPLKSNVSSNDPIAAVIFVGAAIISGEMSEPCSHGHPEDQIKCKKALEKNSTKEE